MFHKNKKAINLLKFQLNKTQNFFPNYLQNNQLYNINLLFLFTQYYISNFVALFLNGLNKKSKSILRSTLKKKKRKYHYFLSLLQIHKIKKLNKIKLILLLMKLKKKKCYRYIRLIKKKSKYKFKVQKLLKKTSILYNSQSGCFQFFLTTQNKIVICLPTSILLRSGYILKKRFFWKTKKVKKIKVSKMKIIFLKLFFFKYVLEKLFSLLHSIKLQIFFLDSTYGLIQSYLHYTQIRTILKSNVFGKHVRHDFIFKKLLFMTNSAYYFNDTTLLLNQLAERLTKIYKHKYAINQFKKALYAPMPINSNILGIHILICGKINAKRRTKTQKFFFGVTKKVQTIANSISYNMISVPSYTGIFGLHVWFVK